MFEPEGAGVFKALQLLEMTRGISVTGVTRLFLITLSTLRKDDSAWVDLPQRGIISTEYDLTKGEDPSFDTELRCDYWRASRSWSLSASSTKIN